jgi:hypothetical protein
MIETALKHAIRRRYHPYITLITSSRFQAQA